MDEVIGDDRLYSELFPGGMGLVPHLVCKTSITVQGN